MSSRKGLVYSAVLTAMLIVMSAVPALAVVRAKEGVITRVDSAAKTVAIKTADGAEDAFKFTGETGVRAAKGVKAVAADTYFAGKEGTHIVVHYTEEGTGKTAIAIDDLGKDAVKVGKGTVEGADKAGRTITVAAEDGTKDTYHIAKDATVDSEQGVVRGTEYAAEKGEKVTVHYTEEAGKKVAHFITHG